MIRNIMTWNVRGSGKHVKKKIEKLCDCINEYDPLIILLQDAGCEEDNNYINALVDNSYVVYDVVAGYTDKYRLITAVRYDIEVDESPGRIEYDSTYQADANVRRPLLLKGSYNGVHFHLYNVYNITNQRKSEYEMIDLYTYIQSDGAQQQRIVAGDFNMTSTLNRLNIQGYNCKRNNLDHITATLSLINSHHIQSYSDHEIFICEIDFQ